MANLSNLHTVASGNDRTQRVKVRLLELEHRAHHFLRRRLPRIVTHRDVQHSPLPTSGFYQRTTVQHLLDQVDRKHTLEERRRFAVRQSATCKVQGAERIELEPRATQGVCKLRSDHLPHHLCLRIRTVHEVGEHLVAADRNDRVSREQRQLVDHARVRRVDDDIVEDLLLLVEDQGTYELAVDKIAGADLRHQRAHVQPGDRLLVLVERLLVLNAHQREVAKREC